MLITYTFTFKPKAELFELPTNKFMYNHIRSYVKGMLDAKPEYVECRTLDEDTGARLFVVKATRPVCDEYANQRVYLAALALINHLTYGDDKTCLYELSVEVS